MVRIPSRCNPFPPFLKGAILSFLCCVTIATHDADARRVRKTFRMQRDSLQQVVAILLHQQDSLVDWQTRLAARYDSLLSIDWRTVPGHPPPVQSNSPWYQRPVIILVGILILMTLLIAGLCWRIMRILGHRGSTASSFPGVTVASDDAKRLHRPGVDEAGPAIRPTDGVTDTPAGEPAARTVGSSILLLRSERLDEQQLRSIMRDFDRHGIRSVQPVEVTPDCIKRIEDSEVKLLLHVYAPAKRQGIEMDQILHGVLQALQAADATIPIIIYHDPRSNQLSSWDQLAVKGYEYAVVVESRLQFINEIKLTLFRSPDTIREG